MVKETNGSINELNLDDCGIKLMDGYLREVQSGTIVVSSHVRAAVARHVSDLVQQNTEGFEFRFDRDLADFAITGFPLLFVHTIGKHAGTPFVLSPWQAFIVGSIFGWTDNNRLRRFRRAYVTLGRKNGKSTLAAGIAILLAAFDGEQQAQVYIGATKADQAKIVFNEADRMVKKSPRLSRMADPRVAQINFPATNSYIRPLGSDRAFDGLNPHCIVLDELHAWKEQNRPFYDTITTGSAARSQPLRFTITTAGDNKSTLWKEENAYSIEVVHQRVKEETYFVFNACVDKDDDPLDEAAWIKAMPNLGVSVGIDYIREQAREAQVSPQSKNRFVRYFANREVSSSEQAIDPELWDACAVSGLSNWKQASAVCAAVDAGGVNDLMSYAIVARFPDGINAEGKPRWRYEVKSRSYIDVDCSRNLNESPWLDWIQAGKLRVCGDLYSTVREDLAKDMRHYKAKQIGFDPWNMQQMGEELQRSGFEPVRIPQQRYTMHEPTSLLLELIRRHKITHDGTDSLFRWALGNLVLDVDSDNRWKPSKAKSGDKIDPVIAVIMALRQCSLAPTRSRGNLFVS